MKKVLVSPGYGAGFATWANRSKALAEDEILIRLVEEGKHLGETTEKALWEAGVGDPDLAKDLRPLPASFVFARRAYEIEGGFVHLGGVEDLMICEVEGSYCIEEYDGSESIRTSEDWW